MFGNYLVCNGLLAQLSPNSFSQSSKKCLTEQMEKKEQFVLQACRIDGLVNKLLAGHNEGRHFVIRIAGDDITKGSIFLVAK